MENKNEDRIDLTTPEKIYVCSIWKLNMYFPELKDTLKKGKRGSVIEDIDGNIKEIAKVKEFTEDIVPHLMTGRQKFTATPGVGVILPTDPKGGRMGKRTGKEEWEQILPENIKKRAEFRV